MKNKGTELANPLLSYIGGVFDLGGCVKIETPKQRKSASLYVWITSKHVGLMEVLLTLDAYIGKKQDGQYRAKWKDNKAYTLLKSILPYLRIREDQAQVGIEFFEEKKQSPEETTDVVYKLRLKLLKKGDEGKGEM